MIVYFAIIFLLYAIIILHGKYSQSMEQQTEIIRTLALQQQQGSIDNTDIVFIIPAYNESDHVLTVLEEILTKGYGVIFVDDGSTNTLYEKVLHTFTNKPLLVIKHSINLGQGAALQTGFKALLQHRGKASYAVTFDADGQHVLADLPSFLNAFAQDPELEIALGSRFL